MHWYIWLLIGLWAGMAAGFLLACLLYCSKEADLRATLLLRLGKMGPEKLGASGAPGKIQFREVGI